ncbi:hypothetical protein JKP88DRAFT_215286 [Tribonema minus]|uniref:Uncharacterized protein n=1 Tax=Tribonema minus TaxID=303371 RepID=A0A835Z378_9STRA|nr:hypothetical protein JKP88DRAFT_215286 [Tribonema minus]
MIKTPILCALLGLSAATAFIIPAPLCARAPAAVARRMAADEEEDMGAKARHWGADKNWVDGEGEAEQEKFKPGLDRNAASLNSVMGQHDVDEAKEGIMKRDTVAAENPRSDDDSESK